MIHVDGFFSAPMAPGVTRLSYVYEIEVGLLGTATLRILGEPTKVYNSYGEAMDGFYQFMNSARFNRLSKYVYHVCDQVDFRKALLN